MPVPGEYFEARERALLGTRYDVLYAAPCAVRRGVTVNGLRCAPQEFEGRRGGGFRFGAVAFL